MVHYTRNRSDYIPPALPTGLLFSLLAAATLAGPLKQMAPSPASSAGSAASAQTATRQLSSGSTTRAGSSSSHIAINAAASGTNVMQVDLGQAVVGGNVFSTGTDDVLLKILTPSGLPYPPETVDVLVSGRRIRMANPNVAASIDDICLVSPGPARALASNRQYDRVINLGKLPPGEIIFAIRTPDGYFFKTGEASRNSDGRPHAIVKTFRSGAIQVWFEDQAGPRSATSDLDCNDAVFELTGGVADNNAVAELLKTIREQNGEARQQALDALRQINPKAFALASIGR